METVHAVRAVVINPVSGLKHNIPVIHERVVLARKAQSLQVRYSVPDIEAVVTLDFGRSLGTHAPRRRFVGQTGTLG